MSIRIHAEYYAVRVLVAQIMSASATDPRAAAAHADMSARYGRLAALFDPYRAPQMLPADII